MKTHFLIQPQITPPTTEVLIGNDLLKEQILQPLCQKFGSKIAVFADKSIANSYGNLLQKKLNAELFIVPKGEEIKTRESCEKIEDALLKNSFGKSSVFIALGGGATTDAIGFIASTYLRGVPLILIPTTLLAMVDAAIGGKTAINTSFGKNLIGTTYHPKAVVIDLNLLDNLPQEQWNNGAAEIWKLGLVCKPEIFGRKLDIEQISEAIKTKASIVEKDPTDSGIRRILNFGHTIGHGIEKLSNYQFPHGLCVAIGSVAASHLSMQLGFLSAVTFEKIVDAYKEFPLSLPENYNRKDLFTAMAHDKKTIDQKIRFVLIDRIGHAIEFDGSYCKAVEEKDLKPTLQWMETWLCK